MTFSVLRISWLLSVGFLSTACDQAPIVAFAQPFPAEAPVMVEFPVRHLGVYTAADSSTSLCIGPTAVWRQELRQ